MFDRQKIVKDIIDYCNSIGVNPLLPAFLILLVIDYLNMKKIKKWKEILLYEKVYIIIGWTVTLIMFCGIIIATFF